MAESRTEDLFIDLIKGTQKDFEPQSRFESYMKCIINKSDPAGTPTPESRKDVLMRTYAEQVYNGGGGSGAETDLKKYVDDNFVKKVKSATDYQRVYAVDQDGKDMLIRIDYSNDAVGQSIIRRDVGGSIYVPDSSIGKTNYNFSSGQEAVNKNYVDEADKDLRLKLSNLEQALNGYILDTTKETYADLDSAVLKNSVAVGDNVYPIADKTRALVTRIEGKTTKDENGNIYPAKISGVKFTGKNLFDINQFEDYKQNDTSSIKVINDKISITGYPVSLPNSHYFSSLIKSLKPNTQYALSVNISNYISDSSGIIIFMGKLDVVIKSFPFYKNGYNSAVFSLTQEDIDTFDYVRIYGNNETRTPLIMTNLQIEENSAPTAYEPYTEPVSVTLPETYDLHGIGDYKDYLEITKNENNELYTLKKLQSVEVNESENTITPLATPVETVIATNLTYEQVTAIRHNGGLIEVAGNINKAYAKPTIKNTVVYRLTAANTTEG